MKKPGARKLTDEHRAFLVKRMACFDGPKDAAAALKQEFGIEISPQATEAYDPNKYAGRNIAQKWRELFEHTRKSFLDDVETFVPAANKAVRVKELWHAAQAFKGRGNYIGMADMLERIAKELGNVHTNKREVTGKDGKPLQVEYTDLTDDQLNTRILQRLGEALSGAGHERTGD